MRIAIGCDHRGFEVKSIVMKLVEDMGHVAKDCGCHNTTVCDYPDVAVEVAGAVAGGDFDRGVLICYSGVGMSITANKIKGIRAALACNKEGASLSRRHNDANVLCLGAEWDKEVVSAMVSVFLSTDFEGGRHKRRVDKITALES